MLRDKTQLPFAQTTLLGHALQLLRSLGFHPRIAGVPLDADLNAVCIPDNFPQCGPLAGIEAALAAARTHAASSEQVLFLPVDLPLLPASFLQALWHRAQITQALATIPTCTGRPQPLCAVYSTRLGPALTRALAGGQYKVMRALEQATEPFGAGALDQFSVEALEASDGFPPTPTPPHTWFTNCNTPSDWQYLQRTARLHPRI
jgi:molybdopterin-guanine dinucleotide biosynthesis protein A